MATDLAPKGLEPTHCAETYHITNVKTAKLLVAAAATKKFFWIDDVFVTGYVAKSIGIRHVDIGMMTTYDTAQFLLHKSLQSSESLLWLV